MDPLWADRLLLRVVDDALSDVYKRAGGHLVCRAGCTECCVGPFPITMLDALRLKRGLAELSVRDPQRAEAVRRRAVQAMDAVRASFPGDPDSGVLDGGVGPEHPFWTEFGALSCPALDPATGLCELYVWRPITCRSFGPPVRVDGQDLPPCRLCFQQAKPAELEAFRVTLDPDGVQDMILAEMGTDQQTLIAAALSSDPWPDTASETETQSRRPKRPPPL